MSTGYFVALCGELPDLQHLGEELAERGGVEGSWDDEVTSGGVAIHVADGLADRVREMLAEASKKLRVSHVLVMTGGSVDDIDDVGLALIDMGGAILGEDGEVWQLVKERKRPRAAAARPPAPQLDTSIPPEVAERFGAQMLYEIHPRQDPEVRPGAIVAAIPRPHPRIAYARHSPWDANLIGQVYIKRRDSGYFALDFEYWHVQRVEAHDWTTMLHLACGLARHTRGVLRRGDVTFDFDPGSPLPAGIAPAPTTGPASHPRCARMSVSTSVWGAGRMVVDGHRIVLAWSIAGAPEQEAELVLGASRQNPALEALNGTKVGGKTRVTMTEVRDMAGCVPPCADADEVTLELEVRAIL